MRPFNIAANTWKLDTPYEAKAIQSATRYRNASSDILEKQAATYDERMAFTQDMERRDALIKEGELDVDRANAVIKQRETLMAENEQALAGLDEAFPRAQDMYDQRIKADPNDPEGASEAAKGVFAATLSLSSGKSYQDAYSSYGDNPWDPVLARAWAQNAEVTKADAKQTEDERLINGLDIPQAEKDRLLKNIAVKRGTVTGRTAQDVSGDPRTPSQLGAAYQARVDAMVNREQMVGELGALAGKLATLGPGAVGLRGVVGNAVGGVIGNLYGRDAGDAASTLIAGEKAKDLQEVKVQAQSLVAKMLPTITGDTSGRYTEGEQLRAKQVQATLDKAKDKDQVMTSLGALLALELRAETRTRMVLEQDLMFNPDDDKAIDNFARQLEAIGFSQETVMKTMEGIMNTVRAGRIT